MVARTGKRRFVNISNTEEVIFPAFFGTSNTAVEDPRLQRRPRFVGAAPRFSLLKSKTTVLDADKKLDRDRYEKAYGEDRAPGIKSPRLVLEMRSGLEMDEPLPFEWGQLTPPKFKKSQILHYDYYSYGEK